MADLFLVYAPCKRLGHIGAQDRSVGTTNHDLLVGNADNKATLAAAATVAVDLLRKGSRVVAWVKSHQRQPQQQGQQQPHHQQERRPRSWGSYLIVQGVRDFLALVMCCDKPNIVVQCIEHTANKVSGCSCQNLMVTAREEKAGW